MKVLFLDIDGVLNSIRTCTATGAYPHDFDEKGKRRFDWIAVSLIRKLCVDHDAKIVISSTWRTTYSPTEIGLGLTLPCIDRTPVLNTHRGVEIDTWLNSHPEVTHYAIVDDDSDMLFHQREYFVQTDAQEGLLYRDYKLLDSILRKAPIERQNTQKG